MPTAQREQPGTVPGWYADIRSHRRAAVGYRERRVSSRKVPAA